MDKCLVSLESGVDMCGFPCSSQSTRQLPTPNPPSCPIKEWESWWVVFDGGWGKPGSSASAVHPVPRHIQMLHWIWPLPL